MPEIPLGKLVRVDPRKVFTGEATDFTPWLSENLTSFNEALGLEIELVQREMPVGDFAVDIFGREVGSGREVIIENQLAPTDHGHLGQLLTYAAGLDAKIVVWISPRFRDEHRQALEWLNRDTTESLSFFGVELELLQIANSPPAPNFKLVAQPSEWQKAVRNPVDSRDRRQSERQMRYHEFFVEFVDRINGRSPGFTNIRRVGYDSWLHFATGRAGFAYSVSFVTGDRFRVELEIDVGDRAKNREAFEQLLARRDEIETGFGREFSWDLLEHRRAQRIFIHEHGSIDSPHERLEQLKEWGLENLLKFRDVLGPKIRQLRLEDPSRETF